MDEDGRIFIDRDPELFAVVLQAVRVNRRPARNVIERLGLDLRNEADYFCLDWLADTLRGKLSPTDLPPVVARVRAEEECTRADLDKGVDQIDNILVDLHQCALGADPKIHWGGPLLFEKREMQPLSLPTYVDFMARLDTFSGGLVENLRKIPGVVVAGGSVLGALLNGVANDLDIFIIDHMMAKRALREIFEMIQRSQATLHGTLSRLIVMRTKNAITFYRTGHPTQVPVQVIVCSYSSTTDLLVRFDVDCCAVAWEPQNERVVATPRGLRALRTRVNVADSAFESRNYIRRLEKYADQRGFSLFVPGLDMSMVRQDISQADYIYYDDIDLLVKVSEIEPRAIELMGGRVRANAIQRATSVRGMERLLAINNRSQYKRTCLSRSPLMSAGRKGRFWIVHGLLQLDQSDESDVGMASDDDDAGEFYRHLPMSCVHALMEAAVRAELCVEGHKVNGGAIPASQVCRRIRISEMLRAAAKGRLAFVFDYADCTTPFDDLKYLHDPAREPLHKLPDEAFEAFYNLPRKLTFQRRLERRCPPVNWWDIY